MNCGVWNQLKIWSSHLLDNLSNCLMNLKNSGDSTGFESMTSAMPVKCSNQLSYEVTQLRAGQFVGLMFSRERNVVWKKCYMKCGVWNQLKIWSSHLLDKHRTSIFLHLREHFLLTGSEKEKNFKDQRISKKLEKHKVAKKKKKRNQFIARTLNPFPWVPSWIGSVTQSIHQIPLSFVWVAPSMKQQPASFLLHVVTWKTGQGQIQQTSPSNMRWFCYGRAYLLIDKYSQIIAL